MRKVKISSEAKLDLIGIEEYLLNKWNEKVADNFYQKLIDAIDMSAFSKTSKIRKIITNLSKNNKIDPAPAEFFYVKTILNFIQKACK